MMQGNQAAELELALRAHIGDAQMLQWNRLRLEREIREHKQLEANHKQQGARLVAVSAQGANPLPMSRAGNFHGQPTVGPSNLNPGNTFSNQVTQFANPIPAAPPAATAVPRYIDTTAAQVMAQPEPARRRYRCGFCKMEGHNRKGCPHAQRVDTAPAPAPDDESDSDKSDNEDHYDDPDASPPLR